MSKFHPKALWAHSKTEGGQRAIRYSATSLICVGITQVLIILFMNVIDIRVFDSVSREIQSNLAATMLTSIPAFALNKYWVWGKRGRAHMRREVLPFWAFTVAGWILSTGMVALVTNIAGDNETEKTILVMAANIMGFGTLWVLKYLFLDKIMFGADHHTPYDEDIELEEAGIEPDLKHV
ncbi:MAG TPA: GtrA family protein [Acidimicrobiales bacterium]|nr:GtrA family protein [Acidimicrobiales bacterium]